MQGAVLSVVLVDKSLSPSLSLFLDQLVRLGLFETDLVEGGEVRRSVIPGATHAFALAAAHAQISVQQDAGTPGIEGRPVSEACTKGYMYAFCPQRCCSSDDTICLHHQQLQSLAEMCVPAGLLMSHRVLAVEERSPRKTDDQDEASE